MIKRKKKIDCGWRRTTKAAAASKPISSPGNTGKVAAPQAAIATAGSHKMCATVLRCALEPGWAAATGFDGMRELAAIGPETDVAGAPRSSALKSRCASHAATQAISTLVGSACPRTTNSFAVSTTAETMNVRPTAAAPLRRAAHAPTPIGA